MNEMLNNNQVELPTFQNGNVTNGPVAAVIENKWTTDYLTSISNHYTTPNGNNDRVMLLVSCLIRGNYIYPRFEIRKSFNNYINPVTKKVNRDSVLIAPFDYISFLAFIDACKREILKGTNENVIISAKNYDYVNNERTNNISVKADIMFGLDTGGYYIIVKSPTDTEINHFNKFYIKFSEFLDISKNERKLVESYVITWLDSVKDWVNNIRP